MTNTMTTPIATVSALAAITLFMIASLLTAAPMTAPQGALAAAPATQVNG